MRLSRAESRRPGALSGPRTFPAFCLVESLFALVLVLLIGGMVHLSLHVCLQSPQVRLALARRESQALGRWFEGIFRRAMKERRAFFFVLPASEIWDSVELRWEDSGAIERFDGRGRLKLRAVGPVSRSVFSPTFRTLSPAFSLYLYATPVRALTDAFGYLVVSAYGRVRFSETPP